jgi:hypothetical protein
MNPRRGPPAWADALVSLTVDVDDRENVPGDLLEEYCESILPTVGRARADLWYLGQVFGYVWRATALWGALHAGAFLARTTCDWFWPTHDFLLRASISTYAGVAIGLSVGLWSGWRTASLRAGAFAGLASSAIAAVMTIAGLAGMFAVFHDPATRAAIAGSGGLPEGFELPVMLIGPNTVLGVFGAVPGKLLRKLSQSRIRE